jgi:hypothetical protein
MDHLQHWRSAAPGGGWVVVVVLLLRYERWVLRFFYRVCGVLLPSAALRCCAALFPLGL